MFLKKAAIVTAVIVLTGLAASTLSSCSSPLQYAYREVQEDYVETTPAYPMEEHFSEEEYAREERGMVVADREAPDFDPGVPGAEDPSLRHVIRRGSIDLAVSDTRETLREVQAITRDAEGLVASLNVYEIREGLYGARATLRIPEKRFETVLEQLENLGKATNVQSELEDITMQYIDLESRLKNQEAQEERLMEILDMADTVEDVLEIEKELNRVRGEIESMSARLTHLKDQVTFATINLNLREESVPTETVSPQAFHNLGSRISEAFIGSVNFILNAVSGLIVIFTALIPALFLLVIIGVLVWLIARRHFKARALNRETQEEQPVTRE